MVVPITKEHFKINFDGAYKIQFDGRIDWKDQHSNYAASYARLRDGGLIYIAERLNKKWFYGLWNPPCLKTYKNLRECRNEIRNDFKNRLIEDGLSTRNIKRSLYFANMHWGTNYVYRRNVEYQNDMWERYGTETENDLLDYAVYFVYSNVHEHQRLLYIVERIGSNWLGHPWDGAHTLAGGNLKECQVEIWKHVGEWHRSNEFRERLVRYQSLMSR